MTYREYEIPKKGGKVRKIVAPDAELKTFLRSKLPALTKYYYKFAKMFGVRGNIHGFVPSKNCKSAATLHIGYKATVLMDISAFFDSVTREHIPSITEVTDEMFHKEGYTAQGFPTSPMLANIAVTPILSAIKMRLTNAFGKDTFQLTIYADDVQVSLKSRDHRYLSDTISIITEEFTKKGFNINKTKTRVRYADNGYRRILGINVGDSELRSTRSTRRKMRAAKHNKNIPSLIGHTAWANHISS